MRILAPLRERDFALLWSGMTVSLLGDGIYLVAVAWQVYDLSNDPASLSLVGLSWTLGMVLFLLLGGVVSDRVERRRVLIAADLVRAGVLAVIGTLALAGVLEVWHLVALALGTAVWQLALPAVVCGACMAGGMVVWGTLMQTRVPPALRGRVHSLDWFISVALAPVSFGLTAPVWKAIGTDATLIVAGVVPSAVTAMLFVGARLRRDEERVALQASGGQTRAVGELVG